MSNGKFEETDELKKEIKRLSQFEDLYKQHKEKIKSLEDKLDIERAQNLKLQNEILHERSQGKLLSSSLLQSNEFLKIQVTTLQQKIEDSSKNVSRKSDPLFYDKMLPSNEEKSPKRDYDNYSSSSKYDSYDRDEKRKRSLTPEKKRTPSPRYSHKEQRRSPDSYKRSPDYRENYKDDYKPSSNSSYKDDYKKDSYKRDNRSPKQQNKKKWVGPKIIQCRFFGTSRGCPKGNECTFLHEEKNNESQSNNTQQE